MIQCSNLSVIGCTNSKLVRLRWFSCQVLYRRRYKFESRKVFQNSCQIFEQLLPENSSPRAFKIAQSDHTGWSTVVRPSASYTGELGFESTTYNYSYLYLFIGSCLWPKIGKWMARFENKIWSSVVKLSLSPLCLWKLFSSINGNYFFVWQNLEIVLSHLLKRNTLATYSTLSQVTT